MTENPARRRLLASALALPLLPLAARAGAALPRGSAPMDDGAVAASLARLQARHGGRLGVAFFAPSSGRRLAQRGGERFLMCSTFKWLVGAHVLARVDAGDESLDRRLTWTKDALVSWSPVTEKHVDDGLTLGELCHAAITTSDNTAANLLVGALGGTAAVTAWLRGIGDGVTRLDRLEPHLNAAEPGDPRDSTTPNAMVDTLDTVLLGEVLSPASRRRLTDWLLANTTGGQRLRAGLSGWKVGDKTGSDGDTISNDVGIAWPPGGGEPVLVACYFAGSGGDATQRDAVIADVGRLAGRWALAGG